MYGAHSTGSDPARVQDEIKPNTHGPNNNPAGINGKGVVSIFWTDKRVADLRDRWSAGDSASVIADALATTRNAIIGKVHRLGLSVRTVKNDARGKNLPTAKRADRDTSNGSVQTQTINRAPKVDGPPVSRRRLLRALST